MGKLIAAATDAPADMGRGDARSAVGNTRTPWTRYVLLALLVEKILQHSVVTLALYFDWRAIRSRIAVTSNLLMILGAVVAVLFVLSFWGIRSRRPWAISLVIALALFDMVGECVAQGTLAIAITVSFLVAAVLLIATLAYRRQELKTTV